MAGEGIAPSTYGEANKEDKLIADLANSDRAYEVTIQILDHETQEVLVTEKTTIKE